MATYEATARANANIALAKYWGKIPGRPNIPAVPSISMTLDGLFSQTSVRFSDELDADRCVLNGRSLMENETTKIRTTLDRMRAWSGRRLYAHIETHNNFPTAAGLASSASGFAALVTACAGALGLGEDRAQWSREARRASVSAARSIYGGYVLLEGGSGCHDDLHAVPLYEPAHWPLSCIVAVVDSGPKKVASTEGMKITANSSPFFEGWVASSSITAGEVALAVEHRDIDGLGRAMEQSTFRMHACAMASDEPVLYWKPSTLSVIEKIWQLRQAKACNAYVTMDAGPQVKIFCEPTDALVVRSALEELGDVVEQILISKPGKGSFVLTS